MNGRIAGGKDARLEGFPAGLQSRFRFPENFPPSRVPTQP